MHKSELATNPDLTVPTILVICDKCRETGLAGDEAFSAIPDILNFTPVPRRARADGWKEEHQRAYIAALAITGSPRQAARAIGKHQFGAEQLRNARGGKDFAAAWDAAIDLAREREAFRIHDNLAGLSQERDAELAQLSPPFRAGAGGGYEAGDDRGGLHPDCDYDPAIHTSDYPEYWEAQQRIRRRILGARQLLLASLSDDEEKMRAWELLCGPVDWEKARNFEPQDDEAFMPSMHRPDMQLTVEAGLLPELTGGPDALAELREAVRAGSPGD